MSEILLTAPDIAAIKAADRFYVGFSADGARLVAIKALRQRRDDPFTVTEFPADARREINVNRLTALERGGFCIYRDGGMSALRYILRPGDALYLQGAADGGNNYTKAARIAGADLNDPSYHPAEYRGLHVQELRATVTRKGRTIVHDLILAVSITPDNTAKALTFAERAYSLT